MADDLVVEVARAKLNLDLHVVARRPDGYHDLDSLVTFADLGDRLTFAPAPVFQLEITGPHAAGLEPGPDNLVHRAAMTLAALLDRPPGVAITLDKHLPVAAGIGGGSADAAATLRGLLRFWDLAPPPGLAALALGLGADVPVCLGSRPVLMAGVGERLQELPDLPSLDLVLLTPPGGLATASVFAGRRPEEGGPRPAALPPEIDADGLARYLEGTRNDLAPAAGRLLPAIGDGLAALARMADCRLARMSGSGPTCFGLFGSRTAADAAVLRLRQDFPGWWAVAGRTG